MRQNRINDVLRYILHIDKELDENKKGQISKNMSLSCLVDNSIEISNISLTPKDLIDTHHIMTLIMKN